LSRLHPDERALAETLRGFRQAEFVGGRLAARDAMQALGRRTGPVLRGVRGEPVAPPGVSLSISHKRHLAVAVAARSEFGGLGVDLEVLEPEREGIQQRVLVSEELESLEALEPDRRWTSTVLRFSIKEAIYKALAPRLQRYIGFEEAIVHPSTDGTAEVRLALTEGASPLALDARYAWLDRSVLATVRVQW
jgi:enterobactin synthetase component D